MQYVVTGYQLKVHSLRMRCVTLPRGAAPYLAAPRVVKISSNYVNVCDTIRYVAARCGVLRRKWYDRTRGQHGTASSADTSLVEFLLRPTGWAKKVRQQTSLSVSSL